MRIKNIAVLLACLLAASSLSAQNKPFSEWESAAYCSYSVYHPWHYVTADNNWEILQALQVPRTRQEIDSLGIKTTASQMMMLRIEGLVERGDDGRWVSLMPLFDSLRTAEAREYSCKIAGGLYPAIKDDCSRLVTFLRAQHLGENAFSIVFSYLFDGKMWDFLNPFEDLESGATWSGECWAFYYPREFSCGTNTYYSSAGSEFNVTHTDKEPDFVGKELNGDFAGKFLSDFDGHGKILSPDILDKAVSLGLADRDGSLRVPVIGKRSYGKRLEKISENIVETIVAYFDDSDAVPVFQRMFNIGTDKRKLACTILYHEVMWDLMDLLTEDNVMDYPAVWGDGKRESTRSVVYVRK